ncbi:Hsp20 family protein [Kushneria phyllosphaerae]|uniref:Small heat shock protein IbpA n=1 Tax=Kushneria phyllosphaerae TaxID=2100822 RepID=A0A2R8CI51_9GAMM|nr:Hsp20 family protein [Kushneria phyllosphaerae]SPJ32553.1 Small heat shock protein IbpA [Kushneria phyllosphaerae]
MNAMTLSPLFRRSIGFDRLNDLFEQAVHNDGPSYPPYNVEKHGDNDYRIAVATAGFAEEELDVNVENRVLTITGGRSEQDSGTSGVTWLHRGIAKRAFRLSFRLDENIEIQGARLENGLLMVDLLRVVPEQQRARQIPINTGRHALSDFSNQKARAESGETVSA